MDYRQAGVDVVAGRAFVDRIRDRVLATHRPEVLGGLGGFGGCFELPAGYREPVLVSGTDGVGTKLEIAQQCDRHDTVGIDLVAMCVNDVLTTGAEPLFFLDYIATGRLEAGQLAAVVEGVATGCEQAGCALLGGETAEMPGFYGPGQYDLAGYCTGIVEKSQILGGARVQVGDGVLGLASSGCHSNGFSLVRRIVAAAGLGWGDRVPELGDPTLGEIFLTPTQIYVRPILDLLRSPLGPAVHALAHITGGGLPENLPRCLGPGQAIALDWGAWPVPAVFDWLAKTGEVAPAAMADTFNLGVGLAIVLPPAAMAEAIAFLGDRGIVAWAIGQVVEGQGEVLGLPTE